MPRLIRVVALLAAGVTSIRAQDSRATDKGSVLIGGSAALTRTTNDTDASESSSTLIYVSPRALFFVAPRFGLGGDLSLGRSSSGGRSSTGIGVGPAVRYYFVPPGRSTLPYAGAAVRFNRLSFELPTGGDRSETFQEFEGVLGIDFMISRQVGIVAEAFASTMQRGSGSVATDATTIGLRFGIDAFFLR
jgi:Outer membrane protein beta-barrel domain